MGARIHRTSARSFSDPSDLSDLSDLSDKALCKGRGVGVSSFPPVVRGRMPPPTRGLSEWHPVGSSDLSDLSDLSDKVLYKLLSW